MIALNFCQSAKNVTAAYDSITALLDKVQQFTGRLQEYTKGIIEAKLRQIVVNNLVTLLYIFARSEQLMKRTRTSECAFFCCSARMQCL